MNAGEAVAEVGRLKKAVEEYLSNVAPLEVHVRQEGVKKRICVSGRCATEFKVPLFGLTSYRVMS